MKEQLVTFQTALKASKLYDNYWGEGYTPDGKHTVYGEIANNILAPTQSLLQRWLREKHQIFIDIFFEEEMWSGRVYKYRDPDQRWQSCSTHTYEDTLETMLQIGLGYV